MIEKAEQAETDFAATHRDFFAGQGGSYEIVSGRRKLAARAGLSQDEVDALNAQAAAVAPDAAGGRGF